MAWRWGEDWGVAVRGPELRREAARVLLLPPPVSGSAFLSSDLKRRLGALRVEMDPFRPGGPCANQLSRGYLLIVTCPLISGSVPTSS